MQVAGRREDRVGRVVWILVAVAVGVHAVLRPRGGQELHPTLRAGARDAQVSAVVGLDLVDRRQHLPGDPVGGPGRLENRQQERRDLEAFDEEGRHAGDRFAQVQRERGGERRGLGRLVGSPHLFAGATCPRFGAFGLAALRRGGVPGGCRGAARARALRFLRLDFGRRFSGSRDRRFAGSGAGFRRGFSRRSGHRRNRRQGFGRRCFGGAPARRERQRQRAEDGGENELSVTLSHRRSVAQQVVEEQAVGFGAFGRRRVIRRARRGAPDRLAHRCRLGARR